MVPDYITVYTYTHSYLYNKSFGNRENHLTNSQQQQQEGINAGNYLAAGLIL